MSMLPRPGARCPPASAAQSQKLYPSGNKSFVICLPVILELLTLSSFPYSWNRNQLFQKMSQQAISAHNNLLTRIQPGCTCTKPFNWSVQVKPLFHTTQRALTRSSPWPLLSPELCQVFSGRAIMIKQPYTH